MDTEPSVTLEQLAERMRPIYARAVAAEVKMRERLSRDLAFWGYEPPTRRQRIVSRLKALPRRARDAWMVLIGKAEIEP